MFLSARLRLRTSFFGGTLPVPWRRRLSAARRRVRSSFSSCFEFKGSLFVWMFCIIQMLPASGMLHFGLGKRCKFACCVRRKRCHSAADRSNSIRLNALTNAVCSSVWQQLCHAWENVLVSVQSRKIGAEKRVIACQPTGLRRINRYRYFPIRLFLGRPLFSISVGSVASSFARVWQNPANETSRISPESAK